MIIDSVGWLYYTETNSVLIEGSDPQKRVGMIAGLIHCSVCGGAVGWWCLGKVYMAWKTGFLNGIGNSTSFKTMLRFKFTLFKFIQISLRRVNVKRKSSDKCLKRG